MLWAFTLTGVAAIVVSKLVRLRLRLTVQLQQLHRQEKERLEYHSRSAGALLRRPSRGTAAGGLLHKPVYPLELYQPTAAAAEPEHPPIVRWKSLPNSCVALLTYGWVAVRRFWLALHFKAMVCSVCALLEGTAGWVSGDAWTQAYSYLFFWISLYPTPLVLLYDTLAAALATAVPVLWLLYVAEDPFKYSDEQKMRRSTVEKFFLTNAMSFFVGWCYITWLRDLVTLLGDALQRWAWGFYAQLALVICFGPGLTTVTVCVKMTAVRRYARQRAKTAAATRSEADDEHDNGSEAALATGPLQASDDAAPLRGDEAGAGHEADDGMPQLMFSPLVSSCLSSTAGVKAGGSDRVGGSGRVVGGSGRQRGAST